MDSEENAVGQELEAQPEQEAVVSEVASIETQAPEESTADEEKKEQARPSSLDDLKPGMRMKGKIRNIVDFGAFVDIGVGRDGLAHISTLKRAGIDQTLKVGDVIDVQVRRVDLDNNRISLTVPGAGKNAKTSLRELKEGGHRLWTRRCVWWILAHSSISTRRPTDCCTSSQLRSGLCQPPFRSRQSRRRGPGADTRGRSGQATYLADNEGYGC